MCILCIAVLRLFAGYFQVVEVFIEGYYCSCWFHCCLKRLQLMGLFFVGRAELCYFCVYLRALLVALRSL